MRVLVVDDQRFWRERVREVVESAGHEALCVKSADLAISALVEDSGVDVVLTDWEMPGLSGVDLCRRVRAVERSPYLPVLLMTSRAESGDLVEALEAGADAFLRKPIEPAELLAQLRVVERILRLESRLEQRIHDLTEAQRRIERDLAHAASVQRALLPAEPPSVPGVDFAWLYQPSEQLGGDVFNVFRLSERHVGLYVLDVSGHGTSAALHSVSLSRVLHPFPQQGGLLKHLGADGFSLPTPAEVAGELNRRFPLIELSGHYFTFLYGILDLEDRRLEYVRAGHPAPLLVTSAGATACDAPGDVPIGVTEEAHFRNLSLDLQAGDTLVLLTDGVLEETDAEGAEFGLPGCLEALSRGTGHGVRRIVHGLGVALDEFHKPEPRRDDVTIVGMQVR